MLITWNHRSAWHLANANSYISDTDWDHVRCFLRLNPVECFASWASLIIFPFLAVANRVFVSPRCRVLSLSFALMWLSCEQKQEVGLTYASSNPSFSLFYLLEAKYSLLWCPPASLSSDFLFCALSHFYQARRRESARGKRRTDSIFQIILSFIHNISAFALTVARGFGLQLSCCWG